MFEWILSCAVFDLSLTEERTLGSSLDNQRESVFKWPSLETLLRLFNRSCRTDNLSMVAPKQKIGRKSGKNQDSFIISQWKYRMLCFDDVRIQETWILKFRWHQSVLLDFECFLKTTKKIETRTGFQSTKIIKHFTFNFCFTE